MGVYTLPLKRVIELVGGTVEQKELEFDGKSFGRISVMTGGDIGLGSYPIFNEQYRAILNGKIIDRYWNREIGFETIDLFRMKMRVRMNEIMPYYNQMYESTLIEYEALSTIRLETESHGSSSGEENATATATGRNDTETGSRAVNSTTPQTMLAGNEDYASNATDSTGKSVSGSENSSESSGTSQNTTQGDTLVSGYQGTPADLVMRFRDSLINVDLMTLRDIEPMFMQTFDNADSYTERGIGYGYY